MDIVVKSRNCDVPARLKQEAMGRVEHATRFFDRLQDVELIFFSESNPRIAAPAVVEVTARTKGHHIRAQGVGADHRGAVDAAVTRFERQLSRYKARLLAKSRGKSRMPTGPADLVILPAEDQRVGAHGEPWPQTDIARVKSFTLQPMLPDDAVLSMELLGHDFFVFFNATTQQCNVLYRRRDGSLGLIETVPPAGGSASPAD